MDYFVWTPELSVDIPEIDEEHMKWISYINALHLGIEKEQEKQDLEKLLDDVIDFSKTHFEHEQKMFEATQYPDTDYHKGLHKKYLEELSNLKTQLQKESADVLTYDVMLSLKKWLINHVQEVDTQYVSYVKESRKAQ